MLHRCLQDQDVTIPQGTGQFVVAGVAASGMILIYQIFLKEFSNNPPARPLKPFFYGSLVCFTLMGLTVLSVFIQILVTSTTFTDFMTLSMLTLAFTVFLGLAVSYFILRSR